MAKGEKGGANQAQLFGKNQIGINPNVPLTERPVIALTVAVLCNIAPDLKLVSDHRRTKCAMGTPDNKEKDEVEDDIPIALCLASDSSSSTVGTHLLGGDDENSKAVVKQWLDYVAKMSVSESPKKKAALIASLDNTLQNSKTFLMGGCAPTLADIAMFSALGWPAQNTELKAMLAAIGQSSPTCRWLETMASHPAIRESTQLALGVAGNAEAVFCSDSGENPLDDLISGMNPLEGGTPGRVCTRFPPEPSGYLHIGHAKAVLLNDYYARRYKGKLICRFDDTNPSKEKDEYQTSIMEDLKDRLKVHPEAMFTFTSDYFGVIKGYADYLIANGLAFMDDTPQDEMQKERMERVESKHRNQSVEECQKLFKLMCSGSEDGAKWCLRIKMDMSSDNGTLRDPVIYRQNTTPHHRTGTTHSAYPTYDLACPIVDSLEGVTHALRTTEFNDRDEQYAWIQRLLKLRRSRIHAFARVNFQYTELSKRKLAWFVDQNLVEGWDDARFPTIRGVVRRGVNISSLRKFMCSQGASRRVVNMEWGKFWAENKKEIDLIAKRFMAIHKTNHVKLFVENGPDAEQSNEFVTVDYLPKDPSFGKRPMRLGKDVILEAQDMEGVTVGEEIVLLKWGVVKITQVEPSLVGQFIPDGNIRACKRKITWLASHSNNTPCILTEFDNLISKGKLDKDDDFKDFLNPHTMATSEVVGDATLKTLEKDAIVQLERRGYFRVDRPYLSEEKPLVLYMIPDGKAKPMSGLVGSLAHR